MIGDLFGSITEWFSNWTNDIFGAIFSFIPKLFYLLCTFIFAIMDLLQIIFRKAVGLDVMYDSAGNLLQGDLVTNLIGQTISGQNSILHNIFIGLIVLGAVVLVVSTFAAIIRSEYIAEDSKTASKSRVFSKAIKAVFSFLIVPLTCYFGLVVGNALLRAIDSVTSYTPVIDENVANTFQASPVFGYGEAIRDDEGNLVADPDGKINANVRVTYTNYRIYGMEFGTTAVPLSGQIFRASAYRANRYRSMPEFKGWFGQDNVQGSGKGLYISSSDSPGVDSNINKNLTAGSNYEVAADRLDTYFVHCYQLKKPATFVHDAVGNGGISGKRYMYNLGNLSAFDQEIDVSGIMTSGLTFRFFDKYNVNLVWGFYDLWKFDFVVTLVIATGTFSLLFAVILGMMKRMFELLILFLIAPPIAAIMPLDNGEALKKWRGKFVGKAIAAYAAVGVMNIFFILMAVLGSYTWFPPSFGPVNYLINCFVMLVGVATVKDMVATVSEIIGAEDAMKSGQEAKENVGRLAAGAVKMTASSAHFAKSVLGKPLKVAGKLIGKGFGAEGRARRDLKRGGLSNKERAKLEKMAADGDETARAQLDAADERARDFRSMSRSQRKNAIDNEKSKHTIRAKIFRKFTGTKRQDKLVGEAEKRAQDRVNRERGRVKETTDEEANAEIEEQRKKGNIIDKATAKANVEKRKKDAISAKKDDYQQDYLTSLASANAQRVNAASERLKKAWKDSIAHSFGALGTHFANVTMGPENDKFFGSFKQQGGSKAYKIFKGGLTAGGYDLARMQNDSYKQLWMQKEAEIQNYRAGHKGFEHAADYFRQGSNKMTAALDRNRQTTQNLITAQNNATQQAQNQSNNNNSTPT